MQPKAENISMMRKGIWQKKIEPNGGIWEYSYFGNGMLREVIRPDGGYGIISDHLGTPVEAYNEEGKKVWERELDIYGRVKKGRKDTGEKKFVPFRFQGQYEDEETGLYYNRFRYYSPEDGCYTQQDPIGLAGGNPTIYGYVFDTLCELDPFGLDRMPSWMPTRQGWQRHHLISFSIWNKYDVFLNSEMDVNGATNMTYLPVVIIPGLFEPPVRTLRATIPENESHIFW